MHHRFRTPDGGQRSSVIIAFHRVGDHPGRLLSDLTTAKSPLQAVALDGALLSEQNFLQAVEDSSHDFGDLLIRLGKDGLSVLHEAKDKSIDAARLSEWRHAATSAPRIEDLKRERLALPLGEALGRQAWATLLSELMLFDKHGPLDLILYDDSREEPRKWARNRTREMRADVLRRRLTTYTSDLRSPSAQDLLAPGEVRNAAAKLRAVTVAAAPTPSPLFGQMPAEEARRSIIQLVEDSREAAVRAEDIQTFVSTSLFLFWAADDTVALTQGLPEARDLAVVLLRNYAATALLQQLTMCLN